ncbi:MAG: hypothetical protein ACM3VX_04745 [Bacteroidota bacterium]
MDKISSLREAAVEAVKAVGGSEAGEWVNKAVYLAGILVGRATTPWREQGELRLKARVARFNRLLATVMAASGCRKDEPTTVPVVSEAHSRMTANDPAELTANVPAAPDPTVALGLLEARRFGGLICLPGQPLLPRILIEEFLGPAIAELTGGWPEKVGICLALGIGESAVVAAERAWSLLADGDVEPGIRVNSGRAELDRSLWSLWALTEAVTSSWTGRQRKLFQIYREYGPQVSRVAEISGMSPSAVSHMLRRMHVHEVEEGRRAFLVVLQESLLRD